MQVKSASREVDKVQRRTNPPASDNMRDFNTRSHGTPNHRRRHFSRMTSCHVFFTLFVVFVLQSVSTITAQQTADDDAPVDFAPQVTATCKAGTMNIRVLFPSPFSGAIHARDFRNPHCMSFGNGTNSVSMTLNLQAKQGQNDYCGILVSNANSEKTEERSIQLAVRVHKTLELADDKFYVITCGKTGFSRDDTTHVALKFIDSAERRVRETIYGREYTVRAELTKPNSTNGLKVKNCFAFSKKNSTLKLIDERGCSLNNDIITRFKSNSDGVSATAMMKSMFKFPDGSEVHLQCDIVPCTVAGCAEMETCAQGFKGRSLASNDENLFLAATTVFVLDPADAPLVSAICEDNGIRPSWLLWVTIALAVLFLIMLLMNIFLCTAMSCSCARTEIIEKEPSIIEEYDPYRSWHGSQYGSRYSLHGRENNGHNKGYMSGGSTIHSTRSMPFDSDHYAIVHSRPGSRGAQYHLNQQNYHHHQQRRGPPSNL